MYIPGKIYHYIFFSLWYCLANKVNSTCFLHKCTTQMTWAFTYLNLCCCNYNNSSSILVVHTIGQSGVVHIIIADNQPFGSLMRVQRVSCHICEWTAIISVNWCEKGHVSCPITTQFAWTMPGLLMWLLLRKHVARTLLAKQFHEEKISSDISYLVYYMYYLDNSFDSWLKCNFLPTHQFWILVKSFYKDDELSYSKLQCSFP